ncbi:MAG: preprotein translocase subunit YajC [Deltaproteobacteria bacterium]|nr:preprotein translocase subunit YajC [Deltaproteobacteria bacterium]
MISLAHAQTAAAAPAQAAGPFGAFSQFLPIILIVAVFYFLLIRPQQKQQKRLRQMIADVKRGDEVVMTSGIYGKITELKDDTIMLQVANNIVLKFQRSAIQSVKGFEAPK